MGSHTTTFWGSRRTRRAGTPEEQPASVRPQLVAHRTHGHPVCPSPASSAPRGCRLPACHPQCTASTPLRPPQRNALTARERQEGGQGSEQEAPQEPGPPRNSWEGARQQVSAAGRGRAWGVGPGDPRALTGTHGVCALPVGRGTPETAQRGLPPPRGLQCPPRPRPARGRGPGPSSSDPAGSQRLARSELGLGRSLSSCSERSGECHRGGRRTGRHGREEAEPGPLPRALGLHPRILPTEPGPNPGRPPPASEPQIAVTIVRGCAVAMGFTPHHTYLYLVSRISFLPSRQTQTDARTPSSQVPRRSSHGQRRSPPESPPGPARTRSHCPPSGAAAMGQDGVQERKRAAHVSCPSGGMPI